MSDSNPKFDITTEEGRKTSLIVMAALLPSSYIIIYNQIRRIGKALFEGISSITSGANEKEIEEQRKVAIDIIRAGKENGADEIEITMSQKAGLGLSSDVDGVPIEFIAGTNGIMKLKDLKYK